LAEELTSPDERNPRQAAGLGDAAAGREMPTLRVAIGCPGVGVVQRGFERFFTDLFGVMSQDFQITLFKGGGETRPNEKVLPFLRRGGTVLKTLPVHRLVGRTALHAECLTFALALLPHLRAGAYDVVHVIDPPLARVLFHLRRVSGLQFRLLYTEGCAMPPGDYPPTDHTQQVAAVTFDEAAAYGHDTGRMTLLPCGIHPGRFATPLDRAALRRLYGVDDDTFVVLSVAALNRNHKRTHHLVEEAAKLPGKVLLWLDGSLDHGEPDLIDYAHRRLGERCRVTHVPSDKVGELYHLADVMAHAATFEAFGLSMVEAAACGTPVVAHDAPHFRWLLAGAASFVDMTAPGALAARLAELMEAPAMRSALRQPAEIRERYAWEALRSSYADLYREVAATAPKPAGASDGRRSSNG
jgi:glycosyltransferase involved in cell wall biosynthesis